MSARSTLPVAEEAQLLVAAEKIRARGDDTAILEFFERRKRRAQAVRAREIAREVIEHYHQHPEDKFAELALHLALEQERLAERAYLDPLHYPRVD